MPPATVAPSSLLIATVYRCMEWSAGKKTGMICPKEWSTARALEMYQVEKVTGSEAEL